MNKSRLALLISVGVLVIGLIIAGFVVKTITSYHKLTVVDGGIAANFYQVVNGKNTNIQSLHTNQTYSVQNGDYCVEPTDTNYDVSPICTTIKDKDATITINSPYSTDYLSSLLTDSLVAQLGSIISSKYAAIIDGFTVDKGQLFDRGEYYGTTLTVKVAPQDRGDVYRTILKKDGDTWSIVAQPQIVLSKYDYPSIPFSVLTAVNQLPGAS